MLAWLEEELRLAGHERADVAHQEDERTHRRVDIDAVGSD